MIKNKKKKKNKQTNKQQTSIRSPPKAKNKNKKKETFVKFVDRNPLTILVILSLKDLFL